MMEETLFKISKKEFKVKKRKRIDLEMKLNMIMKYETGRSLSSVAREYGLASSTVSTIIKDSARIKEHVKGPAHLRSTVITKQRTGAISEMEHLLITWMENQIQNRAPLSIVAIQAKARSIYEEIKDKYGEPQTKFVASNGWFNRFKFRAGFHKVCGEFVSADSTVVEKFCDGLAEIIDEGGYSMQQIFNIDKTSLYWKKMPMPGFKESKEGVNLILGANATGDYKLKPLFVYHSENPRSFKGIDKDTLPVYFRSNHLGRMSTPLFEDWFICDFIPEVEEYCKEKSMPFKILVLLNNAPDQTSHLEDINPNIRVIFIPPNTSTLIKPFEYVFLNFKACYLRTTFTQALSAIDSENNLTLTNFWKSYNIYDAIINIHKAWSEVTESCLNSVWNKMCPRHIKSFVKEESYEEVTGKILKIAELLQVQINVNDVEELIEEQDEKEINNEDFVGLRAARLAEENTCVKQEETNEKPRCFNVEEMELAFGEIASAMARFENMDPDSKRSARVSNKVNDMLGCYKKIYLEMNRPTVRITQPSTSTAEVIACEPTLPVTDEQTTQKQTNCVKFEDFDIEIQDNSEQLATDKQFRQNDVKSEDFDSGGEMS